MNTMVGNMGFNVLPKDTNMLSREAAIQTTDLAIGKRLLFILSNSPLKSC